MAARTSAGTSINVKSLSVAVRTDRDHPEIRRSHRAVPRPDRTADRKTRNCARYFLSTAEDVAEGNGNLADSLQRNGPGLSQHLYRSHPRRRRIRQYRRFLQRDGGYTTKKRTRTSDKIKAALGIPDLCHLRGRIVVLVIVMAFVMPTLADTFKSLGGDLPAMTKAMIAMSEFFQKWWIVMIIVLIAAALFITLYGKTDKGPCRRLK
jgi:type IV pilus assembly protein PilC